MSANNSLFWVSLVLGAAALIWLLAAKALQPAPQESIQPAADLPSDPE
jgi:hypothetical protein